MLSDFEKKLQKRFAEQEVSPPPDVWDNIAKNLPENSPKTLKITSFRWYAVAASVTILVTIASYWYFQVYHNPTPKYIAAKEGIVKQPESAIISQDAYKPDTINNTVKDTTGFVLPKPTKAAKAEEPREVISTPINQIAEIQTKTDLSTPNEKVTFATSQIPIQNKDSILLTEKEEITSEFPQKPENQNSVQNVVLQKPSAKRTVQTQEISLPKLIGNAIAQRIGLKKAIQITEKRTQNSRTREITLFGNPVAQKN